MIHGVREGAGLLANDLELPGVLGELEARVRNLRAIERGLEHGLIEQRGIAEGRRGEDDALGARRTNLANQRRTFLLFTDVACRGCDTFAEVGIGDGRDRIPGLVDLAFDEAKSELEVVIDDVASGRFECLDQADGRLLAECAADDDANVVVDARVSPLCSGCKSTDHRCVLGGFEHAAGARHEVSLRSANAPWLAHPDRIELGESGAAIVLDGDGGAQTLVVERAGAALVQLSGDAAHLRDVEASP